MDYSINIHQFAHDALPPEKRTTENVASMSGVLAAFDRQWTVFLANLKGADVQYGAAAWTAGTYSPSDVVIYYPTGEVYECQVTTTTEPSTSTDWLKIADCFIGFNEMQHFDGTTLSLTYALNRRFMTTYANPPATSDIYIVNTPLSATVFYAGTDELTSSSVGPTISSEYVMSAYSITPATAFDVQVPTSVMTALGSNAENIIRQFIDKYVILGIHYTITPY